MQINNIKSHFLKFIRNFLSKTINFQNDEQFEQIMFIYATELGERFAFNGLQCLGIAFLTQTFLSQIEAYYMFSAYLSIAALTPFIGGFLSDNFIGTKRALFIGSCVLAVGYTVLPICMISGTGIGYNLLLLALSIIAVGNGLYKPTSAAMMSCILNDPSSQQSAYIIYYMIVNLGSLISIAIAPIISGMYGFFPALVFISFGMFVTFVQYVLRIFSKTEHLLTNIESPKDSSIVSEQDWLKLSGFLASQVFVTYFILLYSQDIVGGALAIIVIPMIFILLYIISDAFAQQERTRNMQLIGVVLCCEAIVFFLCLQQVVLTFPLFAANNTNLAFLFWRIEGSGYNMLNPVFIVLFAPLVSGVLKKYTEVKTSDIFAIGTIIASFAFFLASVLCKFCADSHGIIDGNWFIVLFLIVTFTELIIATAALSVVSQYFRKEMINMGLGFFFLSQSVGAALSGAISTRCALSSDCPSTISIKVYQQYYQELGMIILASGIFFAVLSQLLKHIERMHQETEEEQTIIS